MEIGEALELRNVRVTELRPVLASDPLLVHRDGLVGTLDFDVDAHAVSLSVSRLGDEERWTVDACFVDHLPHWCNGIGARYLRTRWIRAPALIEPLDQAAAALMEEVR